MADKVVRRGIAPIRVLPLGFFIIILIGAWLLTLPLASADGTRLPYLSALFTATSASCVTGLVVVDTGTYFSFFGQMVILILIQLGGLGFMTMATILFVLLGKRISLKERMTIAESFGESRLQGIVKLGMSAAGLTFFFETIGAILLSIRFVPVYGPAKGIWYGVFHSISAFCNAGFDLIGGYRSFTDYTGDLFVNLTLICLIVLGGLGYAALLNLLHTRRTSGIKVHTKLVLTCAAILIGSGTILFYLLERNNPATLGNFSEGKRWLASLFQSVTLRTAGFNTIDEAALTDASKIISSLLMLIGGAPGGTAGGIKTTTMAVMVLTVLAETRGKRDVEVFHRRLPETLLRRALCLVSIWILVIISSVTLMSVLEQGTAAGELGFINQVFEAASALGTVGVSSGLTALSGPGTRMLLIIMMYMGRVGMLTLALALTSRKPKALIRLPETEILVG